MTMFIDFTYLTNNSTRNPKRKERKMFNTPSELHRYVKKNNPYSIDYPEYHTYDILDGGTKLDEKKIPYEWLHFEYFENGVKRG